MARREVINDVSEAKVRKEKCFIINSVVSSSICTHLDSTTHKLSKSSECLDMVVKPLCVSMDAGYN